MTYCNITYALKRVVVATRLLDVSVNISSLLNKGSVFNKSVPIFLSNNIFVDYCPDCFEVITRRLSMLVIKYTRDLKGFPEITEYWQP